MAELLQTVDCSAWVCRPDGAPSARALDLISDRANRWNADGEPTIYVSGDAALAMVEAGRHPEDLTASMRLFRIDLRLERCLDIRRSEVRASLGLPADAVWVLDRERTREVAGRLRGAGGCDGLLVPSAGAVDQADRWNAVVFADDRSAVTERVGDPQLAGIQVTDGA
jgi:RES domain-containing protein